MKSYTWIIVLIVGLFLVGCNGFNGLQGNVIEPLGPDGMGASFENDVVDAPVVGEEIITEETVTEETVTEETAENTEEDVEEFDGFALSFVEGELIDLDPMAVDPDGDEVFYTFSEPLNNEGKWQTQIGDEGRYLVSIEASDGDLKTESSILLIIERANRAPVIDCDDEAVLREGERFYVGDYCEVYDEDDEEVVVYYSGWPGVSRYVTTYSDAGKHTLLITANDKTHTVKHELPINVINANRAPMFPEGFPEKIVGMEGDILTIDTTGVVDPDGDDLSFSFSEPFDNDGIWKTKIGDAGTYDVDVVAKDNDGTTKATVIVEIQLANTKPVLKNIANIEVNEGETIKLAISATDREGDPLSVKISGWMNTAEYTTTYDDAGEYTVKVVVSDGEQEASQIVDITVKNVNRAPQFVQIA